MKTFSSMNTPVKFTLAVLATAFAVVLQSCGATTDTNTNAEAAQLTATRDSLRTVIASLNGELADIEARLAEATGSIDLVAVTAIEAPVKTYKHYFTIQGNIETDLNALVFPESQGIVKSILVREGQRVTKGQALMSLDTELIQKNIDEVETQYTLAKDIFERQERLWQQKIGSELQYLEAKTNKERLENTLATLNKQKSMGTVKAPFDGVIDNISPRIGEMASPAMPVARIISLDNMFVRSQLSENYISVVAEGMPAEVVLPGGDTLTTAIKRIGKYINPENRTFEVTLDLPDSEFARPNMFCSIRVNDLTLDSAVVVRSSIIMQDIDNREFVYTLNRNGDAYTVRKAFVKTGSSYGGYSWIESGLAPGDLIVDKGARRVIEDQTVALSNAN